MNIATSITTAALLAAALNVASAESVGGQPFADSTGGSSQVHGELATTAAGIVPLASSSHPTRRVASAMAVEAYSDSTGGSSAARAEYLLDHAQAVAPSGTQASARNRYQPYLDSTGGTSLASSERALEAEDAASAHRTDVAIAPAARTSR
jgi:hypothetical protein